jgi:hypothetical protein
VSDRRIGQPSIAPSRALKMGTAAVDCRATMRLPVSRILLLVCALLAAVPATASAAAAPKVTSVAPLKLKVGDRMTIRGKGFLAGKNRNTVIFKATGTRAVFAKAETATKTKIVVKVPAKLLSFLKVTNGQSVATRFQIRVLAKRLSPSYTPSRKSPVIAPAATEPVTKAPAGPAAPAAAAAATPAASAPAAAPAAPAAPADCDRDGMPDTADADDDNDLLLDVDEAKLGTQRCDADSDGDGLTDGWEYKSAYDLNQRSCPQLDGGYPKPCTAAMPYPGKRAYPNPLDNTDAGRDFDGDGISDRSEFDAWRAKATKDASWNTITDLWYSGGKQASQDTYVDPTTHCTGMPVPAIFDGRNDYPEFARADGSFPTIDFSDPTLIAVYSLDNYGTHALDGCLDDAERDEDGDLLNNWTELSGPLSGPSWWAGTYGDVAYSQLDYQGTEWLDADTDGDETIDGLDDQDDDDFLNVEEVVRGAMSRTKDNKPSFSRSGLWVSPFNPCLPSIRSRTCPPALIIGVDAWAPFAKDADTSRVPRWPLYGTSVYPATDEPDPTWVDTTPADPSDSAPIVHFGPELWSGLPGQQTMPPLHPLPR